jgi:hypothetical protein
MGKTEVVDDLVIITNDKNATPESVGEASCGEKNEDATSANCGASGAKKAVVRTRKVRKNKKKKKKDKEGDRDVADPAPTEAQIEDTASKIIKDNLSDKPVQKEALEGEEHFPDSSLTGSISSAGGARAELKDLERQD